MGDEVPAVAKRRCVLVLNNAIWHKVKTLDWHHIEPLYLPPYSPDFNPIERLWQHPKSHFLAGFITKHNEELTAKLITSIQALMRTPDSLQSFRRTHSE